MKSLRCAIGLHKPKLSTEYLPTADTPIVTDAIYTVKCVRCGKILRHDHLEWNGVDMVEKKKGN